MEDQCVKKGWKIATMILIPTFALSGIANIVFVCRIGSVSDRLKAAIRQISFKLSL